MKRLSNLTDHEKYELSWKITEITGVGAIVFLIGVIVALVLIIASEKAIKVTYDTAGQQYDCASVFYEKENMYVGKSYFNEGSAFKGIAKMLEGNTWTYFYVMVGMLIGAFICLLIKTLASDYRQMNY